MKRKTLKCDWAPLLDIEVTSGNRKNDIVDKRKAYALAGIRRYWIIDRQRNVFLDVKLVHGYYVERERKIGEHLYSVFFGRASVRHLLEHKSTNQIEKKAGERQRAEHKRLISRTEKEAARASATELERQKEAARVAILCEYMRQRGP